MARRRRIVAVMVGAVMLGGVIYATTTTHIEVDITSGRQRASLCFINQPIHRRVEETRFSAFVPTEWKDREPAWRLDTIRRLGGPSPHFRHHGTLSSLADVAFVIDYEHLTADQRNPLIQAILTILQRDETFDVGWRPGELVELRGRDGAALFTLMLSEHPSEPSLQ